MSSVFLVEDEALIRMLLADMIQELGHTVAAEAGSIYEGLSLARSADFDLAILDVNLGKCTVEPIADVINERGLPIIFASASNEGGLPPSVVGRTLLQKPFLIWQLAAAIAASYNATPHVREARRRSRTNVRQIAPRRHRRVSRTFRSRASEASRARCELEAGAVFDGASHPPCNRNGQLILSMWMRPS